jgi:ribulose-phosphate 3-epimerase
MFIREQGVKAGVSLNPATSLMLVEPILPDVDHLLIMTVNPGFGGQKLIASVLPKIRKARKLIDAVASHVLIEVDGGVTLENIAAVAEAGADIMVAGAAIFGNGDYAQTIGKMKAILGNI